MTPHITAKKGTIAKTVLMPGDPLRAKFIADTFLENVELVNEVRNMFMYTGTYKGKRISICGSGMGQPSIGIYSYELFKFYDVDNIIRIGSAGSYKRDLKLYDIFLVEEAYSDSSAFAKIVTGNAKNIMKPAEHLNDRLSVIAKDLNIELKSGRVHSSDVFYGKRTLEKTIEETGADCVEMESAALFANAEATGKNAACLVTISDNLITKDETTAKERQEAFTGMMEIALELVV
ncbi:MAG: purine-nucleoside phosphorylase [Mycoplasmataceae bacterium]|nr:purine-nucleoside phosphorylase [Mycoplasmataceae bacterium]